MKDAPSGNDFRLIPLSKGLFAKVNPEDYGELSKYKWHATRAATGAFYAQRNERVAPGSGPGRRRTVSMQRLVCAANGGAVVDHKNHDTLDNRRANLRVCTRAENNRNAKAKKSNKTGYKGVCFYPSKNKFLASITLNRKQISLGLFSTASDAAFAYDEAAKRLHGEFACVNGGAN